MTTRGILLSSLKKSDGKYLYRGTLFALNKLVKSNAKGKKMMVLATKTIQGKRWVKLVHFGALGYGHNYSKKAKKSYLARSAGIRDKGGHLTKNDRWSGNYWARKVLWPANKPVRGPKVT
jgi:hypothetical protein